MQMVHSYYSTYDRAAIPPPGKAPSDLDTHITSYLDAGWTMAFYSAVGTQAGTVHHFIWKGPSPDDR